MVEPIGKPNRDDIDNKFLQIEMLCQRMGELAHAARHSNQGGDKEKLVFSCKRIRYDLESLEVILGI